jgi:hypothetical protein
MRPARAKLCRMAHAAQCVGVRLLFLVSELGACL